MNLYATIAQYYDEIFPVNLKTLAFVGGPVTGNALLDIGCATGGHCLALAEAGWNATGIDPSAGMIEAAEAARRKLEPELAARVEFKIAGMQDVGSELKNRHFDVVLCTGNTVPHLASERELKRFLDDCKAVMAPGAALIIQMLNYAKIVAEKPDALPSVQGEGFLFSRRYEYQRDGSISFDTSLETAKKTERDSTRLWPFTPDALKRTASDAGLKVMNSYGSWDRQVFEEKNDIQLILVLGL